MVLLCRVNSLIGIQKSHHSVNAKKSIQGLPILLVKSELKTEETLTTNQPNLEPTLTPNQSNCSEEHGGSNNYYLTDLYGIGLRARITAAATQTAPRMHAPRTTRRRTGDPGTQQGAPKPEAPGKKPLGNRHPRCCQSGTNSAVFAAPDAHRHLRCNRYNNRGCSGSRISCSD